MSFLISKSQLIRRSDISSQLFVFFSFCKIPQKIQLKKNLAHFKIFQSEYTIYIQNSKQQRKYNEGTVGENFESGWQGTFENLKNFDPWSQNSEPFLQKEP